MKDLPPVSRSDTYWPKATRWSNFVSRTDNWNKILKLGECSLSIGARVTGHEMLAEVVEFSKNGRVVLLPSRFYKKMIQTSNGVSCPMGKWADGSLRITYFLLGLGYSFNFLESIAGRNWVLGSCTAQIHGARFWVGLASGISGLTSGSIGMYWARALKPEAITKSTTLTDGEEQAAWSKRAQRLETASWISFYATGQAVINLSQSLLPVWGYMSRDLSLGLGSIAALFSFMKSWVATPTPALRKT